MTQATETTAERVQRVVYPWEPISEGSEAIAAEIDALTAERDEARELHKFCDLFLNSANAELKRCESALRLALAGTEQKYFAIPARIDDVRAALADAQAQLAEARAEVERMRPAAEAWEANEEMRRVDEMWGVGVATVGDYLVASDKLKAARARAAKENHE